MKLLIVEDDAGLARGIALSLQQPDRELVVCGSLQEARQAWGKSQFDLVLLDVGLPDGSGLDFCRELRQLSQVPVLFLTANDAEYDEVAGLEAGGDDYITKPFSLAVLRARVDAALRRSRSGREETGFVFGNLAFYFDRMSFQKEGKEIPLSRTEQKLLKLLVTNRGQTLSRELLMARVWDDSGEFVDENTLSVAIRRLRGKLEDHPKNPAYIKTVYGVGYCWDAAPTGKEAGR